jgi:hypothetical protein
MNGVSALPCNVCRLGVSGSCLGLFETCCVPAAGSQLPCGMCLWGPGGSIQTSVASQYNFRSPAARATSECAACLCPLAYPTGTYVSRICVCMCMLCTFTCRHQLHHS